MLSKYFASRTRREFLSICQVCIPNELFRFGSGLCGLLQKQDCIASLHFRLCNGTRHKTRNGTDNLLRPGERVPKSHELSASLTHFDVISRSTSISHALALLWKITLLFRTSEVLIILHRRSKYAWF